MAHGAHQGLCKALRHYGMRGTDSLTEERGKARHRCSRQGGGGGESSQSGAWAAATARHRHPPSLSGLGPRPPEDSQCRDAGACIDPQPPIHGQAAVYVVIRVIFFFFAVNARNKKTV